KRDQRDNAQLDGLLDNEVELFTFQQSGRESQIEVRFWRRGRNFSNYRKSGLRFPDLNYPTFVLMTQPVKNIHRIAGPKAQHITKMPCFAGIKNDRDALDLRR